MLIEGTHAQVEKRSAVEISIGLIGGGKVPKDCTKVKLKLLQCIFTQVKLKVTV